MFHRWGAFVYRHRRVVALLAVMLAIGAAPFAGRASEKLSSGGWLDASSESAQVAARLAADFGGGKSTLIALFRRDAPGADATSPEFQAAIATAVAGIRRDPAVANVVGYAETGDRRWVSTAGDTAYVAINLTVGDEASVPLFPALRASLAPPAGYSVGVSGYAPLTIDTSHQAEIDLQRAETTSLPIVALVLFLVFASIVAAAMPLLVAALAIPTSLAIVYFVSRLTEMSVFVLNIATMLGLALAIDYSLFVVSRFREELARGHPVGEAVSRSVATSGKAVLFSGVAVAVGLSGLMIFPFATIRSIGLGSALVVACSVLFALTFLPAALGMLGPRVNRLSPGRPGRQAGSASPSADPPHRGANDRPATAVHDPAHSSRWARMARQVMAHPWLVLVPVVTALLAAGTPFFHMQQGVPGGEVLPVGLESRDVFVALRAEFPAGETSPMVILADTTASPTDPRRSRALQAYAARLRAVPGVSRVESFFAITDPATGRALPDAQVQQLFALPEAQRPAGIAALVRRYVVGNSVRIDATSPYVASRPEATSLVPTIRAVDPGSSISRVQVGGQAALGSDFLAGQGERLPAALAWTMLATAAMLFLLFGSVTLPVKAVADDAPVSDRELRGPRVHLPGRPPGGPAGLRIARLHGGRDPDHHVLRDLRPVDGLRGAPPVTDSGRVAADVRQHRLGRRRAGAHGARHHRRGPDHGLRLLGLRARRRGDHQVDRRRDGDCRGGRCDDRSGAAGPRHDAAARDMELVGAGPAGPDGRAGRLQPRRGPRGLNATRAPWAADARPGRSSGQPARRAWVRGAHAPTAARRARPPRDGVRRTGPDPRLPAAGHGRGDAGRPADPGSPVDRSDPAGRAGATDRGANRGRRGPALDGVRARAATGAWGSCRPTDGSRRSRTSGMGSCSARRIGWSAVARARRSPGGRSAIRFAIDHLGSPAPRFTRISPTVAAAAGPLTVIGGSGETDLCAHPFGGGDWVSDGSGWRAKPFEPEDCTRIPGPLAAGPAGILDVTSATGEVYGAWLSGDGLRWTDVTPRDAAAAQLWGAAFGGGRYLISGRDGSDGVLWSSPDARSWTRELERAGVDLGVPVAAGGTVLVTATVGGGAPVILRWDAASGWSPLPAGALPPTRSAGAFGSMQRAGGAVALAGTANGSPAAWLSSDGAAWLRLALPDEGAASIGLIGRIGERLVVVQDIDTPAGSTQLVLVRGWPLP